jgi:hypothetical protein
VQIREQATQTCVIEFDGGGPQIMYFNDLTENWMEVLHLGRMDENAIVSG